MGYDFDEYIDCNVEPSKDILYNFTNCLQGMDIAEIDK